MSISPKTPAANMDAEWWKDESCSKEFHWFRSPLPVIPLGREPAKGYKPRKEKDLPWKVVSETGWYGRFLSWLKESRNDDSRKVTVAVWCTLHPPLPGILSGNFNLNSVFSEPVEIFLMRLYHREWGWDSRLICVVVYRVACSLRVN